MGIKILGIVSDAGGNNLALVKALTDDAVVEGSWPSQQCYWFPFFGDWIAIIFCSVHTIKSGRNTLLRSQRDGTRDLMLDRTTRIGWSQVTKLFERETIAVEAGHVRSTRIN